MYTAAVSFDTHKYVKEFIKAGMPESQAEAVVSLINESKDYDLSKLASREQIVLFKQETKNDIERLDQKIESSVEKLDQKIEYFRNESKADIKELKAEMHYMEYRLLFKLGIGLGTLMITIGTALAWYVQFLLGRH